jgi:hypothetical protein
VSARPVPPCQVRVGYILAYDGRELTVIGRYGTWYHEDGKPVAGLAIDCRSGSARWILFRRLTELLRRVDGQ